MLTLNLIEFICTFMFAFLTGYLLSPILADYPIVALLIIILAVAIRFFPYLLNDDK